VRHRIFFNTDPNVTTIRDAMTKEGLIWGGTFRTAHPPHFQLPAAGTRPTPANDQHMRVAVMRISSIVPIVVSIGMFVQCEPSNQLADTKLYLLDAAAGRQWCVYRREAEWNADVQRQQAMVVGTAEYKNDRLVAVNVIEQDESGDWIVYDNYSIGAAGEPQSLKRTVNILPGERSEELVFQLRARQATQQSRTTRQLGTGRPLRNTEAWLPSVRVVTSVEAFPFAPLIGLDRVKTLPSKLCEAVAR
jgi:hypothetical protein